MILSDLIKTALNKNNFNTINDYSNFCYNYLNFIGDNNAIQAIIISQNELNYQFIQYREDGNHNITRPINSDLFINYDEFEDANEMFVSSFDNIKQISQEEKNNINNFVYTCQQTIGATLDALPSGMSNNARKINGDLFERYIRLLIKQIGVDVGTGVVNIPIMYKNNVLAEMSYQHDLIVKEQNQIKAIGSVKTSSKDRIDKIFLDKFLYNKLTDKNIPHFAIFLNDIQRKKSKNERYYGVNATFLSGHFIGYTIKINPLDGVYYCDLRPNMRSDRFLQKYIKSFDNLLTTDIWNFIK